MWEFKAEWHGVAEFIRHGVLSLPFWLAVGGIVAAWYCYLVNPALPERLKRMAGPVYTLLDNKYYFDHFNDWFFAGGARRLGAVLSNVGDRTIIDGFFVNGAARVVGWASALLRHLQTGYVYHYAFTMIIGVFALLTWWACGADQGTACDDALPLPRHLGADRRRARRCWPSAATATPARGALDRAVRRAGRASWSRCRCGCTSTAARRTCSSSSAPSGSRASTSTTSSASTASRCCSCCSTA